LPIDHPSVDLRLKFIHAWGQYLMMVMNNFTYEKKYSRFNVESRLEVETIVDMSKKTIHTAPITRAT